MSLSHTCHIDFEPIGKRVDVPQGTSLMDAARHAGITLASTCGGEGTCGRCRVVIMAGEVSPPEEADQRFLTQMDLFAGQRLACHAQAWSDVKVQVPKASLVTGQRLQVSGVSRQVAVDSAVRAFEIEVPAPTLSDLRSDLARVTDALEVTYGRRGLLTEPAVVRWLSPLLRRTGWRTTAYVRGREIVGFEAPGRRPVGLAVDLGTTKIAGYLVDLETGEEIAATGSMNPQIGYGEDVISRLAHANRSVEEAHILARAVREVLDDLVGTLATEAGVTRQQIAEACLVGNTAMTHLLLELPVRQLSLSPFVSAVSSALDVKARDLGLGLAAGAYVHVLPCVAGFVGADHVAMILASDLDRADRVVLGIDIGTNTEIALYKPGLSYVTSASCASGPAFEGAHIRDGMRAASGAIEAMRLTSTGLDLRTIDGALPVGLCGSGIVDAVAELRRWDIINQRGRIHSDASGVRRGQGGYEFLLVPRERSGGGRDIIITQDDIDEIQLAKGAIRTGIDILLEATNTRAEEIEEVIVAGAFGSYLNLDSALAIGLLPRLARARYRQVGNAAGTGAKRALLSRRERRHAQKIARRVSYIELTLYPGFNRHFARAMLFPDEVAPNPVVEA